MRDIYLSGVGVCGIRYIHTCTHSLDVAINGLFAWLNKYRQKGKNEGGGGGWGGFGRNCTVVPGCHLNSLYTASASIIATWVFRTFLWSIKR